MRAWYMEDLETSAEKDPRLPHMTEPPRFVTEEELRSLGVLYWKLDAENYVEDLERIRKERNYSYMDEIEITPEKLPNYDEKLKIFFSEHFHRDEEIRFVRRGSGYFDVRSANDEWIRIHVLAGDLLVLPAGIYHRFTLDTDNDIVARRLFVGEPVWLAIDRPNEDDPARKQYSDQLKVGFAA